MEKKGRSFSVFAHYNATIWISVSVYRIIQPLVWPLGLDNPLYSSYFLYSNAVCTLEWVREHCSVFKIVNFCYLECRFCDSVIGRIYDGNPIEIWLQIFDNYGGNTDGNPACLWKLESLEWVKWQKWLSLSGTILYKSKFHN